MLGRGVNPIALGLWMLDGTVNHQVNQSAAQVTSVCDTNAEIGAARMICFFFDPVQR